MMLVLNSKTLVLACLCLFSIMYVDGANLKPKPRPRNEKDPFGALGIPDLNPKDLLKEIDQENNKNKPKKEAPQLKTIDDLPNFLQKSNLSEDEGIKVLTRFLIQDDLTLKKYGVVYDQSGFDGLPKAEPVAPIGTDERLIQRARSAANIWFKGKYPKLDYDAYGAENIMDEIVPNWRIFKVLMIGKNGESTFVKICLPLDESETALGSDKDDACGPRTQFVEKEKARNEAYIQQIRSKKFFRKNTGVVKLLPGEKMVVKDSNKTIVLDSHNIEEKFYGKNNNFYNPPTLDQNNNDPLLAAFQRKNNNLPLNLRNFGRSPFQGMNQPMQPQMPQGMPQLQQPNPLSGFGFNSPVPNNMPANNAFGNNIYNNNFGGFNTNFPGGFSQMPQQFKMPNLDLLNNNQNFQQNSMYPQQFSQGKSPILPMKPMEFKFKEKEALPDTSNSYSRLENELAQMKKQLSDMMNSLKEKDMIIKEQNTKLSQFIGPSPASIPQTPNLSMPAPGLNQQFNPPPQYQNPQITNSMQPPTGFQQPQPQFPQASPMNPQAGMPFQGNHFLPSQGFLGYPNTSSFGGQPYSS